MAGSSGEGTAMEVARVERVWPQCGQSKQFAHRFFFSLASALGMFSIQLGQ